MNSIKAVIEIPTNAKHKYEVNKDTGKLVVDRLLTLPIPYNYGYLENTLSPDGDPLDVCIVDVEPIFPLTVVNVVPIGILLCDDNGVADDKIIAVIKGSKLSEETIEKRIGQIKEFLSKYKEGFQVADLKGPEWAMDTYNTCVSAYIDAEHEKPKYKLVTVLT